MRQPWEEGAPAHEWVLSDARYHKLVYDGSGSAWAKPTRAAALRSLGIRLMRWSAAVRRDVERVNDACDVAEALLTVDAAGARVFTAGGHYGGASCSASAFKIRLAE
jgi:DNA-binding GntR family transcriptional regulator